MARYLPIIIVALLMIYCVVEVAQAQPYAVRRMPRWLWATVVICVPLVRRAGVALLRSPERGVARHPEAVDPDAPPTTTWTSSAVCKRDFAVDISTAKLVRAGGGR